MSELDDLIVDKDKYEHEAIVGVLEDKIGYNVDKEVNLEGMELTMKLAYSLD